MSSDGRIPRGGPRLTTLSHAQPEELIGPLTDLARRAAPRELHLRGDRALLESGTRVAVVGSRKASPQGLEWTRRVTEALVARDVTVVSGLARGIDAVAHRTTLDLGGKTAAENSGTRYQGWEAIRLGRPVLFLQRFLDGTFAKWPGEMVKYGAFGFDARSLPRVLDDLPYRRGEPVADGGLLPF